eukprot:scaffold203043_cov21-Tisochrysis_lutea.AAC.1
MQFSLGVNADKRGHLVSQLVGCIRRMHQECRLCEQLLAEEVIWRVEVKGFGVGRAPLTAA